MQTKDQLPWQLFRRLHIRNGIHQRLSRATDYQCTPKGIIGVTKNPPGYGACCFQNEGSKDGASTKRRWKKADLENHHRPQNDRGLLTLLDSHNQKLNRGNTIKKWITKNEGLLTLLDSHSQKTEWRHHHQKGIAKRALISKQKVVLTRWKFFVFYMAWVWRSSPRKWIW